MSSLQHTATHRNTVYINKKRTHVHTENTFYVRRVASREKAVEIVHIQRFIFKNHKKSRINVPFSLHLIVFLVFVFCNFQKTFYFWYLLIFSVDSFFSKARVSQKTRFPQNTRFLHKNLFSQKARFPQKTLFSQETLFPQKTLFRKMFSNIIQWSLFFKRLLFSWYLLFSSKGLFFLKRLQVFSNVIQRSI